jgi:hypothetical protein
MASVLVDCPDELLTAAGSEEAARDLMVTLATLELVRRGLISTATAEQWLGELSEDWMRLADTGGAFDFWNDPAEDIYSLEHGEAV